MSGRWCVLNLETGRLEVYESEREALKVSIRNGAPGAREALRLYWLERQLTWLCWALGFAAIVVTIIAALMLLRSA